MTSIDYLANLLTPIYNKHKALQVASKVYCDYVLKHGTLSDCVISGDNPKQYLKRELAVYQRVAQREVYKHSQRSETMPIKTN